MADALSRFTVRARGLDPYPRRGLRPKFRQQVVELCGAIDFDMLARDDGSNYWGPQFRPPPNSAFEGPLPPVQLRRFPRIDMIDRVFTRAASFLKEDWSGPHSRLPPMEIVGTLAPYAGLFRTYRLVAGGPFAILGSNQWSPAGDPRRAKDGAGCISTTGPRVREHFFL